MADISTLIEYEREHPINIKNPVTGDDMGITINLISKESRRVVAALRDLQGRIWDRLGAEALISDEQSDITMVEKLRRIEEHGAVTLSAAISSWDWGENTFEHISGSGPASYEDAEFLVNHKNSRWIVDQLAEGLNKIENFTSPSPKNARGTSKKK